MNSYEKYLEDLEQQEWFKNLRKQAYYLHRSLKRKGITYKPREKIVFCRPENTADKHIQKLLTEHNYTVQTVIE